MGPTSTQSQLWRSARGELLVALRRRGTLRAVKARRAQPGQLRSMRWLTVRGFGYRLRAALLLAAFVVGSIVGRDAALLQRLQQATDAAIELVPEGVAAVVDKHRRAKLQVRPSGISKRAAWSPTDPPDDDDELDDDSDSLAARWVRGLPVAPAMPHLSAVAGVRTALVHATATRPLQVSRTLRRQRGPPC